jgi:hypothetical protein
LNINNLRIRITIHRTDTVTVIVAYFDAPIVTDTAGLIRLSNALMRVEERLSRLVNECGKSIAGGIKPGLSVSNLNEIFQIKEP